MDKLNLANIQALAASIDYGGQGFLQPSSAALGLSAALFLSDLDLWQGVGYELTDAEIDDIKAMIALLENDLIETGDMYAVDKVKVTNSSNQSIPTATPTNIAFDTEIYDPQGMHSIVTENNLIHALRDGLYLINASISWLANSVGTRELWFWQYHSDTETVEVLAVDGRPNLQGMSNVYSFVNLQLQAIAGDFFGLTAYQTSAGDLLVVAASYSPFFEVVRY